LDLFAEDADLDLFAEDAGVSDGNVTLADLNGFLGKCDEKVLNAVFNFSVLLAKHAEKSRGGDDDNDKGGDDDNDKGGANDGDKKPAALPSKQDDKKNTARVNHRQLGEMIKTSLELAGIEVRTPSASAATTAAATTAAATTAAATTAAASLSAKNKDDAEQLHQRLLFNRTGGGVERFLPVLLSPH